MFETVVLCAFFYVNFPLSLLYIIVSYQLYNFFFIFSTLE